MDAHQEVFMSEAETSRLLDWNRRLSLLFIPLDIVFCLYTIFGVFGNALVYYLYTFKMKGKKTDRYFIPVLAVTDALVCMFGPNISLVLSIYPVTLYGNALCKISIFIFRITINYSVLLTLVIAIQRYKKVCRPLSTVHNRIAAVICFVVAIILAIPPLLLYGEVLIVNTQLNVTGHRCGVDDYTDQTGFMPTFAKLYDYFSGFVVIGVICSLSVMYGCIGRIIRTQSRRVRMNSERSKSSNSDETNACVIDDKKGRESSQRERILSLRSFRRQLSSGSSTSSWRNRTSSTKSSSSSKAPASSRYTVLFMAISIFFILSYIPTMAVNIVLLKWDSPTFWIHYGDAQLVGYTFLYFTYFLNHVVNPFFYAFFDSSFRREVKKCFRCRHVQ